MLDFRPGDIVRISGGPLEPYIGLRCEVLGVPYDDRWDDDDDFWADYDEIYLLPLEDRPLTPRGFERMAFFWHCKLLEFAEDSE